MSKYVHKAKKDIGGLVMQNDGTTKKYCGLDIGTGNICSAIIRSDKTTEISSMRNVFVSVGDTADLGDVNYIKTSDGKSYIFGDHAMVLANIFGQKCRRPMANGVISTSDIDALDVIAIMVENLIGRGNGDKCCYSIPAPPIDSQMNILYHTKVFERVLKQLGYEPIALSQATAVCYSQCENDAFTALIVDTGCGMSNVSLVYRKNPAIQFSTTRGGDWIDEQTAYSLGISAPGRVTAIKEKELDLNNPIVGNKKEKRIREALSFYYKDLIIYTLEQISKKFETDCADLEIPEEIPLIISGGTSKANGYLEFFRDVLQEYEEFPIKIKEIRQATDPLSAVAEGCLIKSISESVS